MVNLLRFLMVTSAFVLGAAWAQGALVFQDVRVFDGETVSPSVTVVVEGDTITAVGEEVELPANAEIIDGAGKTLMPGLIDAHTHTFAREALRQALVFGVTTELDMFTDYRFAAQMREAQAQGEATGRADLFSAGTLATAPGGHGTQYGLAIPTLTRPEEADAWVEARVEEGSDYIKVVLEDGSAFGMRTPTLSEETLAAVIDAAKERGMLTVTHIPTLADAKTAIRAGTDGLAHIFLDSKAAEAFLDLAVQNDLFVIATLAVYQTIGGEPKDKSLTQDPNVAPYLTQLDVQNLNSSLPSSQGLSLANAQEAVRALHERGVPILAGTDAANPGTVHGASLHRELELLVESGLTPTAALAAATSVAARSFGLDNRGSIARGLQADLLLVNGDPTQDITATRDIVGVWKAGVEADREAYREGLEAERQAAAAQTEAITEADTLLVSDFESGDLTTTFGSGWVVSTDEIAGGTSVASVEVTEGGTQESQYALLVRGEVKEGFMFPWAGAMFMPGAQPFAPVDLSSKPTLTFRAKGEGGPYRVQVFCQNLGQIPAEQPFEVTSQWQVYSLDLSNFSGCDTKEVQAVILSAGPTPTVFEFQIDDVAFR